MSLQDLQQFVRTYDKSVFRLVACGKGAPSEERWRAFEKSIDFDFPAEFTEFNLSPLGGLCLEVDQDLWPRPSAQEPLGERSLYSVRVFGIGMGVPAWLDLREELEALPAEELDIVPFMARGDEPDRFCFDLDDQIVRWSPVDGSRQVLKDTFSSLLMREVAALEARWRTLNGEAPPKKKRGRPKKVQ